MIKMSDVNNVFYLDSSMNAHASQNIKGLPSCLHCIEQVYSLIFMIKRPYMAYNTTASILLIILYVVRCIDDKYVI